MHVGHRAQGGEYALPHSVSAEMLFHALAYIMLRNTMMAGAGHGANPPVATYSDQFSP